VYAHGRNAFTDAINPRGGRSLVAKNAMPGDPRGTGFPVGGGVAGGPRGMSSKGERRLMRNL